MKLFSGLKNIEVNYKKIMKWTYDKKLVGVIADIESIGDDCICLASEETGLGHKKKVIAIFSNSNSNDEMKKEAMHDLKRIISCCNYFTGIKDVEKWIKENPINIKDKGIIKCTKKF